MIDKCEELLQHELGESSSISEWDVRPMHKPVSTAYIEEEVPTQLKVDAVVREATMQRGVRLLTMVGAVVLCVPCIVVAATVNAESAPDVVVPQPAQSHAEVLDLSPGPFPRRRGPIQKVGATAAYTIEQAIEQCVEADMQEIGAPGRFLELQQSRLQPRWSGGRARQRASLPRTRSYEDLRCRRDERFHLRPRRGYGQRQLLLRPSHAIDRRFDGLRA